MAVSIQGQRSGSCGFQTKGGSSRRKGSSLLRGSELRSCVKVEVAVLGSPSLISLIAFSCGRKATLKRSGAHLHGRVMRKVWGKVVLKG